MAPKTRHTTKKLIGGSKSDFPVSDLPTYGDIYRYFYFVQSEFHNKSDIIDRAQKELVKIWLNVNPRLPLIKNESIYLKLIKHLTQLNLLMEKSVKGDLKMQYTVYWKTCMKYLPADVI